MANKCNHHAQITNRQTWIKLDTTYIFLSKLIAVHNVWSDHHFYPVHLELWGTSGSQLWVSFVIRFFNPVGAMTGTLVMGPELSSIVIRKGHCTQVILMLKACEHICRAGGNFKISMHTFPKNPELRIKWFQFIFVVIPQQYNSKLTICSTHFEESDFINLGEFSRGFTPCCCWSLEHYRRSILQSMLSQ